MKYCVNKVTGLDEIVDVEALKKLTFAKNDLAGQLNAKLPTLYKKELKVNGTTVWLFGTNPDKPVCSVKSSIEGKEKAVRGSVSFIVKLNFFDKIKRKFSKYRDEVLAGIAQ